MTVAILGTGQMARGFARRLARAKIDTIVGGRDPAKAAALAGEFGLRAATPAAAAAAAEIVILAVPYAQAGKAIAATGGLADKVLVDISNPVTPDYMALTIGHTSSAAEEIQKVAPGALVVKAFNTIFAAILDAEASPATAAVQVIYATDDHAAGEKVAALAKAIGFTPVAAGPLSNAHYIEPLGELNIHFGFALGWGTATAPAWIKLAA